MKARKRLSWLLLTLGMLFALTVPAFADELTVEDAVSAAQRESYAYAAMKRYVGIHALGNNLDMTQAISVYNGEDNAWNYFLFDDTECLGMMTVAWLDGAFTSSFCTGSYDAVEPLLAQRTPFALAVKGDSLLLVSGNTVSVLEGPAVLLSAADVSSTLAEARRQTMTLKGVALTEEEMSAKSASYALEVDIVANKDHPDWEGHGLCWAASAASIVRYWNSSYPDLQTLTIYDRLCTLYGISAGYPYGTTTWINRIFDIYDVSMTYKRNGTNYDTVKNIIENRGCPIIASLTYADGGHNVVISGFTSGYGHYYYILVDSNKTGIVTAEVTNTLANTFTYPSGRITYTGWQYYYY